MSLPLPVRQQLLKLLQDVSYATRVNTAHILGRARTDRISNARFIFIWVGFHHVATQEQIGEFLRRDRTTISHAVSVIGALLKHDPECHTSRLIEALTHDITSPASPTTQPAMKFKRSATNHRPQEKLVAQAAREIAAVFDKYAETEGFTDIEAMLLLHATGAFTMDAYVGIRTARRLDGLEADPYSTEKGFEAWLTLKEIKAEATPKPRRTHPPRTHPPRNPRPAAAAPAA